MTFIISATIFSLALLAYVIVRNHAPSMFAARVAGALYDLGLDIKKLDASFSKKLETEAFAYRGAAPKKANHHIFAVRFFVFCLVESERPPYQSVIKDGTLVGAISLIRAWTLKGKIPRGLADSEIQKIKSHLIEILPSDAMPKEDRLAMEIQILEL